MIRQRPSITILWISNIILSKRHTVLENNHLSLLVSERDETWAGADSVGTPPRCWRSVLPSEPVIRIMNAQSDFYSSLVLEPLRKKISPMVPPRSSSLTQSFMDPLVSQGRDSQDAPTMPSSAQRANPDYFTYPWSGHKRLDTSVIQHILFRRIPWMATSGGVAPSR